MIHEHIKPRTCRCSITGIEPHPDCPVHSSGEWRIRCEVCGVFMAAVSGVMSKEPKPRDRTGKNNPNYKNGRCLDPEMFKLFWVFSDAQRRCRKPKHPRYADYGGRGIEFRFSSFEEWYAELGPRPKGYTMDRKDNNGHYEPGNMRWITYKEQNNNRRKRTVYPPKINNRWARVEKG